MSPAKGEHHLDTHDTVSVKRRLRGSPARGRGRETHSSSENNTTKPSEREEVPKVFPVWACPPRSKIRARSSGCRISPFEMLRNGRTVHCNLRSNTTSDAGSLKKALGPGTVQPGCIEIPKERSLTESLYPLSAVDRSVRRLLPEHCSVERGSWDVQHSARWL